MSYGWFRKYEYKFTIIRWISYIVIRAFVILTSDIILESLDGHDRYKILLSYICKYMYSSYTILDASLVCATRVVIHLIFALKPLTLEM